MKKKGLKTFEEDERGLTDARQLIWTWCTMNLKINVMGSLWLHQVEELML